MAIYQYECACGNKFEEMMSIKSDSKTHKCHKCGELADKVMSSGSFQLKGGGWYKDSYSKKG